MCVFLRLSRNSLENTYMAPIRAVHSVALSPNSNLGKNIAVKVYLQTLVHTAKYEVVNCIIKSNEL